jgi:hypothetical protein
MTLWLASFNDSTNTNKGYLSLYGVGTSSLFTYFRVVGSPIAASGYYKIPVAFIDGTAPTNGATVAVHFTSTGDKGDTGETGATGATGATGPAGSAANTDELTIRVLMGAL